MSDLFACMRACTHSCGVKWLPGTCIHDSFCTENMTAFLGNRDLSNPAQRSHVRSVRRTGAGYRMLDRGDLRGPERDGHDRGAVPLGSVDI